MTTSDTRPEGTSGQDRPPIAKGDLVITWWDDDPAEYGGPGDSSSMYTLSIGIGRGRTHVITCDPDRVAPDDTPIPAHDPRVTVVNRPRSERPYGAPGTWRLTLPGHLPSWHKTKHDGTAAGLRQVAILDWHAARAAQAGTAPQGDSSAPRGKAQQP